MNIKSLLIGSAAALAAVSGAQAADAIVAAEPEPMEYVRVCDAFGTGFFYIPGTETCLKIGGFVRFQVGIQRDEVAAAKLGFGNGTYSSSDWDAFTRAHINFDARNDTELGTLRSYIAIEANSDSSRAQDVYEEESIIGGSGFAIDEAFIELGGLKAGFFYSWWDSGINGETDSLAGATTSFNSLAYNYDGGTWRAGVSIDELEGLSEDFFPFGAPVLPGTVYDGGSNVGVAATVGFSLGGVNLDVLGGYDSGTEEGAIRAIVSAEVGPGTFQLAGVWASDPNTYYNLSEWTIAASYAFKATEKLSLTPAVQYFDSVGFDKNVDAWRVGLTVDYEIVSGLNFKGTVDYNDVSVDNGEDENFTRGFLRLQRNF